VSPSKSVAMFQRGHDPSVWALWSSRHGSAGRRQRPLTSMPNADDRVVRQRQRLRQILGRGRAGGPAPGAIWATSSEWDSRGAVMIALVEPKTWVLCLRRRKAVEWITRRIPAERLRVLLGGSGNSLPRAAIGVAGWVRGGQPFRPTRGFGPYPFDSVGRRTNYGEGGIPN